MFSDVEADVYVLVDGDDTYDAPSAPAMIAKLIDERLDMVVATPRRRSRRTAYRPGRRRQRTPHRLRGPHVRARLHRHPFRLSGILATLREIVPDPLRRFRNRDGADRPRARARIAGRRDGNALFLAAERIGFEAVDLERRLPHSLDGLQALPRGAAAVAVRGVRHRSRQYIDRPRHPDLHHLRAGRRGPAPADRGARRPA